MKKLLFLCFLALVTGLGAQQPPSEEKPKNWSLGGYVKNLQTLIFFNNPSPVEDIFLQDNLVHNRLNFEWFPNENFTFHADLRSRIFFGDLVRANPDYGKLVDNANNDYLDLSLVLLDRNNFVIHTMLDRLYFEYVKNNWEIRLGRQRVNWGINTVWNPNDIFNAFAFTDFDYEERPGSDALRIKYYTGFASSIEIAVKAFDDIDEAVIAGLWKFNKWNYDFQLLAGLVGNSIALGVVLSGNIKNASFKGEFTYFIPTEETGEEAFAATLGYDYSFSNSLFLSAGYLYNSLGTNTGSISSLFSFELSAKNLYPYRHALFVNLAYPISPLLNSGVALIYSPVEAHALFFNPTLTYSITENWDLDFVGQLVFNDDGGFTSPIQALFFRLKYSY